MSSAEKFYKENIENNIEQSNLLSTKVNLIGWSRLAVVVLCLIFDYILYKQSKLIFAMTSTTIFVVLFLFLITYHNNIFERKKRFDMLVKINEKGIKRLNGEFKEFEDDGTEYLDNDHSFVNDLDIFGKNSVFQYINSTVTKGGREALVKLLKREKTLDKNEIMHNQKSIKELGLKAKWRQQIIVEGTLEKSNDIDIKSLIQWSKKNSDSSSSPLRIAIACTFILVTAVFIYMCSMGLIPVSVLLLDLMVNYCVVKMLSKGMKEEFKLFETIKRHVSVYSKILALIEDEDFESSYLAKLKAKLKDNNLSCKDEMKRLSSILDWMGNSAYNAYYLLLNVFLFSDVFLIKKLEKWRDKNGEKLEEWLEVMHEIDSLCSVANLSFDNEEWIYPTIINENELSVVSVGHPLIGKRAVKNTFALKGNQKVSLITGSNMSGKSTFLRTLGVNLFFAYIGAPVCAKEFSCGIMNIYTCMRTKDNLEESISSFYAEILRIKILIEACKKGERVFFLLDEIFKGTNSKDRHTGATVLIKQLIKYGGVGLVSTHDLELCSLEQENKNIINYNFREFYEDNKIKFDYILRRGKSETQNAIHLMKLAGIEII